MPNNDIAGWACAKPTYKVTPLRDERGVVGAHYLDDLQKHGLDFDTLIRDDAIFAEIIDMELIAESIADASLSSLADLAVNERVRRAYLIWLGFMNVDLKPWTTGGAIHFRPHWARTLLLALTLGDAYKLNDVDLRCLATAAVFHDSRRKNPYLDTGHGKRAAEYYKEFCQQRPCAHTTTVGKVMCFDPRCYLTIRWHDRDDELGIKAIEEAFGENTIPELDISDVQSLMPKGAKAEGSLIYRLFKDVDGLDRVRLGKNEPDISFLRTEKALEMLPYAHELLDASSQIVP